LIFGKPLSEVDINQVRFIHWLLFYTRIKTAYDEPPPKSIVNNDYALDRWVQQKQEERRQKLYGNATSTKDGQKKSPRDKLSFNADIIKQ
jgi:hypothetical protein